MTQATQKPSDIFANMENKNWGFVKLVVDKQIPKAGLISAFDKLHSCYGYPFWKENVVVKLKLVHH